ncbi:MAG: GH36-type glycosyl hydrolase domain-containing protein [Candidatus Hydrogenedens sp.]
MQSISTSEVFENSFNVCPDVGAGQFGYWNKDKHGNPCYHLNIEKTMDTDVWHLVGNDHITATAHAKGFVQIYAWDRGPQILNCYDPEHDMKGGGYCWIFSDKTRLCTYLENTHNNTHYEIIWGCGYIHKIVENSCLCVEETFSAPDGKDSILIHELKIKNNTQKTQNLYVIPIWEPNWFPINPGLVMTPPYNKFWNMLRKKKGRSIQNRAQCITDKDTVIVQFIHKKQSDRKSSWSVLPVDTFFISSLNNQTPQYLFTNKILLESFIHSFCDEKIFSQRRKTSDKYCNLLSFVEKILLRGDEEIIRRYLVGYGSIEKVREYKSKYSFSTDTKRDTRYVAIYIPELKEPIDRELQWHSYYLQAGCVYSEYFNRYFVDQGSAYGFIHGASGAPRDWAFFIIPLIYLRPGLAREMLLFLGQLQDTKTGKLPYALVGNGKSTGAGVHSWSSDFDLFFLWAISEYLGATFDTTLLYEEVPFQNKHFSHGAPFLSHIERAFYHLTHKVSTGKHGLIRSGTGDWNDVFLAFSPFPPITILKGESVFNSAMSVLVLPEIAQWIQPYNSLLSTSMNDFAQTQREILKSLWNGKWFPRGYTGIGDRKLGEDNLFLDVQPFAILANLLDNREKNRLIKTIKENCVDTQPFGATCLVPPMQGRFLEPGSDTNGGVWYAINAWLSWAWSECNPQEAWDFLLKNTLFTHAEVYPHIWYGIWSGPDAYNSAEHPRAGETFCLNFTPMTQFPIMNMNCHASILFAVLKMFGLCPHKGSLFINPNLPFNNFHLHTTLISYSYEPEKIELRYSPVCYGSINLCIKLNPSIRSSSGQIKVYLNGSKFSQFHINNEGILSLTTDMEKDRPISLLITI